ncbi:MAG: hypothetical protein J7604_07810 [Sporocytophaga sp.]|uniref:hypothetical protein n=1 Tax=Sporocytophaga sp. TaxID=2231183 RepID=UPI001B0DAE1E|nr:hypothetical protein [Sporocytophaga sp.]MBO9700102.1 hypothetical protein [Sporocytophaga sp.]
MKEKFTIYGSSYSNGEEKEFEKEFEIDFGDSLENFGETDNLLSLLENPLSLILGGGNVKIKGRKRFALIITFFALTNTTLFGYSLYRLVTTGFTGEKLFYVFIVLCFGIGLTINAGYWAYLFIRTETMKLVYESSKPLVERLCEIAVEKVTGFLKGKSKVGNKELTNFIDFAKEINEGFKSMPYFLRLAIIYMLKKIPIAKFILERKNDFLSKDKQIGATLLFQQIDKFALKKFEKNNTYWVFWLWPLNVIWMLLFIIFMID